MQEFPGPQGGPQTLINNFSHTTPFCYVDKIAEFFQGHQILDPKWYA